MPNKPKTQHRSIRVPDDKWDALDKVTEAMGMDRAKAINAFIDWLIREPGAKLPERLPREATDTARKTPPAE